MQVGVAGLGRMGAAITARLLELGHDVTVWNRSAAKTESLAKAGARVAATPRELAERAEIVLSILTDADAIEAVYGGASGLLAGEVAGKLFIEMSTVRPEIETTLAARVRAKGAAFADCPVGGTVGPARQGKLLGLLGADPADAARARALLDQLCRRVEHVGPIGAGATMKLAINLPLMISWQAFGEAFALCRPLGLEPARLIDLFADTSGATTGLKNRAAAIAEALAGAVPGAVSFDLDSGRKDLRTMIDTAKARGVELPLAEGALACFDEASRNDWGARDVSAMPLYWSSRRGR